MSVSHGKTGTAPVLSITRAVSEIDLRYYREGVLARFRRERRFAKEIARGQLHTANVRITSIEIIRGSSIYVMRMGLTVAPKHRYRTVNLCLDCPRRWSEHEVWEKGESR